MAGLEMLLPDSTQIPPWQHRFSKALKFLRVLIQVASGYGSEQFVVPEGEGGLRQNFGTSPRPLPLTQRARGVSGW